MFRRKKRRAKDMDQQLLMNIRQLKKEWENLNSIIDQSIEPSEEGLKELALTKSKYLYLLREARHRGLNALS